MSGYASWLFSCLFICLFFSDVWHCSAGFFLLNDLLNECGFSEEVSKKMRVLFFYTKTDS